MKIEVTSDKIIIYMINKKVNDDLNDIKKLLFDVFDYLFDNYEIDKESNYEIKIYINNLYGVIIEMIKLKNESNINKIGLTILRDKLFLYEVDDPLNFLDNEIYYYNNKFYLNPKKMDINLYEYATLIYDDLVYKVLGRGIKI